MGGTPIGPRRGVIARTSRSRTLTDRIRAFSVITAVAPASWNDGLLRTLLNLHFVARAGELTTQPALLLVSGEQDHPAVRTDAADLLRALRERYANPDDVELITVPDLAQLTRAEGWGPGSPSLGPSEIMACAAVGARSVTSGDGAGQPCRRPVS